ncbi:leucine-rich repeat protein [Saccharicrinis sp. FJH62]|uniref:leucine-rich repeat protein n=1 Tax=Saccharicrinis sp. FJH62 TaxID=3344657 RepID=UPI0035D4B829
MKKLFLLFTLLYPILIVRSQEYYTLANDDVIVENGIITQCTYSFQIKNIIIPDVLDEQNVIGIADYISGRKIFDYRGLTNIVLPSTIEWIGKNAFAHNFIQNIDLRKCIKLVNIGENAFSYNNISVVNLENCSSLKCIETNAFGENTINIIKLPASIEKIGDGVFYKSNIKKIDLSSCINLDSIGNRAFSHNYIESLDLSFCSNLSYIGSGAFTGNSIDSLDLAVCPNLSFIGSGAFAYNVMRYLRLPETIKMISDNCFSNNKLTNIGISSCNELISIGKQAFDHNYLTVLELPSSIESINDLAFRFNNLIELDLSNCNKLGHIGIYAFYKNAIRSVKFSSSIKIIDKYAFSSNGLINVDFSLCDSLAMIGSYAFEYSSLSFINLSNCHNLTKISEGNFNNLANFELPINYKYENLGWKEKNGNTYLGGDTVYNTGYYYYVPVPYILKDEDVAVKNGVIEVCSYNFLYTDIIIPEELDYQKVIGVGYGAFSNKGITSLKLPSTIRSLGNYSFQLNPISNLDISSCHSLNYIGRRAFDVSFVMPVPDIPGYDFTYWTDENSNIFDGGDTVKNYNTIYTAQLEPIGFRVTFYITDGLNPVEGAVIYLDGYWYVDTNEDGKAIYPSVETDSEISCIVTKPGYYDFNIVISVATADTNINLNIVAITNFDEFRNIKLYPNPASEYINIQTPGYAELSIIDISGNIVLRKHITEDDSIIPLNDFKKGTYFFKIKFLKSSILRKVIIN